MEVDVVVLLSPASAGVPQQQHVCIIVTNSRRGTVRPVWMNVCVCGGGGVGGMGVGEGVAAAIGSSSRRLLCM